VISKLIFRHKAPPELCIGADGWEPCPQDYRKLTSDIFTIGDLTNREISAATSATQEIHEPNTSVDGDDFMVTELLEPPSIKRVFGKAARRLNPFIELLHNLHSSKELKSTQKAQILRSPTQWEDGNIVEDAVNLFSTNKIKDVFGIDEITDRRGGLYESEDDISTQKQLK
jgi:hypothetical protein